MRILAIECTHLVAGVAVRNEGAVVVRMHDEWQKTAEAIMPMIAEGMEDAGLVPAELDGVAVSSGPGSFTALRIGMSAAKGIAYGAGIPLLPVPTMQAMAEAALPHTEAARLVPVILSRSDEYYYAVFRRSPSSALTEELDIARCRAGELGTLLERFDGGYAVIGRGIDGLVRQAPALGPRCIEADFFTAASLLPLAAKSFGNGFSSGSSRAVPDYRQMFVPGVKKH
jgi:tRNA threonylcarbamoyladenosine biosynthesis protein TsaB